MARPGIKRLATNPDKNQFHVGLSVIHGKGLFASHKLSGGELIGIYEGETVTEDGMHVLWVEQDDGQWTGYNGTNALRYMNHSSSPNAEMDGVECYAARPIEAGEEITIDYGWD